MQAPDYHPQHETSSPCLRFEGSYKNQVEGLQLDAVCTQPFGTTDGGQESVGNTIDGIPLQ